MMDASRKIQTYVEEVEAPEAAADPDAAAVEAPADSDPEAALRVVVPAAAAAVDAFEAMEDAATAGMVEACAALEALADELTAAAVIKNHLD